MRVSVSIVISFVALSLPNASAAPVTCQTGALIWDIGSGTNYACELGNFVFENFYVIGTTNDPTPTVSVGQPLVSDTGEVIFSFNPNEASDFDIDVYFEVTAINGSLADAVDLTVGGNLATVSERVCTAPILGNPGNVCSPTGRQLASLSNISGNPTVTTQLASTAATLFVFKDVGTQPGGSLSTVSEGFDLTAVPEPNSRLLILFSCALVGIMKLRRMTC